MGSFLPGSSLFMEESRNMKVVCAWCQRRIEGKRSDKETSHGVCPPCIVEITGTKKAVRLLIERGTLLIAYDPWQDTGGEA